MRLLDAVNLIMPKLGERAVTSLQAKHPTLSVLLPIIEQNLRSTLARGWWFNTYDYTAHPGTDGEIVMGTQTSSFVPYADGVAIFREGKLFNPKTMDFQFTEPVSGELTQYLEFDALPDSAATYVLYKSCVEAYATDLGNDPVLNLWAGLSQAGWDQLLTEHLRQRKYSTRKMRNWQRFRRQLQA